MPLIALLILLQTVVFKDAALGPYPIEAAELDGNPSTREFLQFNGLLVRAGSARATGLCLGDWYVPFGDAAAFLPWVQGQPIVAGWRFAGDRTRYVYQTPLIYLEFDAHLGGCK